MVIVGFLSGTIGNALVIYVFARQKPKLTSTIFILALACIDFVMSLVTMPYKIVVVLLNTFNKVQYGVVCKIYQFLVTSTVPFSAFVMVDIAFDRYLCIVYPFKRVTSMTLKQVKTIVAWLFFLAFTHGLLCCLMCGTVRQVTFVKTNNFLLEISSSNETSQYGKVLDHVHSNATLEGVSIKIVNTGYCHVDNIIFDLSFRAVYQKIYSAFFCRLCCGH